MAWLMVMIFRAFRLQEEKSSTFQDNPENNS